MRSNTANAEAEGAIEIGASVITPLTVISMLHSSRKTAACGNRRPGSGTIPVANPHLSTEPHPKLLVLQTATTDQRTA
jgi:hypothetical protein